MRIRLVETELLYAERQTDRHIAKITVAFCNFANAHEKRANRGKGERNTSYEVALWLVHRSLWQYVEGSNK
jgi:hypothetical protein